MNSRKRLLILTEAGDSYPSGKVRAYIYKELFSASGYKVRFKTLLSPVLIKLYLSTSPLAKLLKKTGVVALAVYLDRKALKPIRSFLVTRFIKNYDIIYLQKVLSCDLIEKISRGSRAKLVYDLNDGVWLPMWQSIVKGKVDKILGTATAVTCDNPFGVKFAKALNPNSFLVPDSPQLELFDEARVGVTKQSGKVIIGWIGTPGTLFNLFSIFEPLERIFSRLNNIELRIVGSGHRKDLLPCFERVKYSTLPFYNQKEMIEEVLKMDIGLFPLFDIDNSNARGILKATIYMSGEVAVIGSAIGQTPDLISDGTNGLLARTPKEWEEKLEKLITDSEFRKRLSKNGLETVRSEFTTEQNFKRLLSVFQEV